MNDKKLDQAELLARLIAIDEKIEKMHAKLSESLQQLKETVDEKRD